MLSPVDLIKAGRLEDARRILTDEVKKKPADTASRTLLFQALALCGEYDKAFMHLDMISSLDTAKAVAVSAYKDIIRAQSEREKIYRLDKVPSFLTDAPLYFETYWDACIEILKGNLDGVSSLFGKAEEMRPGISGRVNGREFSGIWETDAILSFFIEAFVHDRYVWIPFESVRELVINEPKILPDTIWTPASITTWEGLTANCFLPVQYPASAESESEVIRLGRRTEWEDMGGGYAKGLGQHVYQLGEKDMGLLEIREIVFNFPEKK